MARIQIQVDKVRKLQMQSTIWVTNRITGERTEGHLRFVTSFGKIKRVIKTKKYSILLFMSSTDLNKNFIFEKKRRIKKFDFKKKLTIDNFL